jgi:hypothetical protein
MGLPNARSPACLKGGALRDCHLEPALTNNEFGSGKSLVVMCRSAAPRLDAVSVDSSRPHQRSTHVPFLFLRESGVISGEISSPKQVMRRVEPMP